MPRWQVVVTTAFMSVAVAGSVKADTITINGMFVGDAVGYFYSGLVTPTFDGNAFAGSGLGSVSMTGHGAGLGPAIDGRTFEAYCVDLFGDIFIPGSATATTPVTVTATAAPMSGWSDPSGVATQPGAGAKAAWLYTNIAPTITRDDQRTALQMAIWNVLYDSDASVTDKAGDFYVWADTSGTIVNLANGYLTELDSKTGEATWLQLQTACVPGTTNCQNVQDFVGPLATVPEPPTLVLIAGGLIGLLKRKASRTTAGPPSA